MSGGPSLEDIAVHFEADCWKSSRLLKQQIDYNPSRYNQMLAKFGAVETARRLIWSSLPSDGFTTLWEYQKLALSTEALVVLPWYAPLFTEEERQRARQRLADYGLNVSAYLQGATASSPPWVKQG
jgi:hypothetical protein